MRPLSRSSFAHVKQKSAASANQMRRTVVEFVLHNHSFRDGSKRTAARRQATAAMVEARMPWDRRTLLVRASALALVSGAPSVASAQDVQYTYDALGRIRTVTYPNGATITYTYDDAGNRTQVTQVAGAAAPTGTFSASPASISPGGSATLSWTSANATSAAIDNGVGAVSPVAGGSVQVSPSATTTYTLTLNGAGGQTTLQTTVTVTSGFAQTIQITGSSPVNLRTLANNAGYNGAQDATITFQLGAGVTISGAGGGADANGGHAIDTGTWPSGAHTIALTLQVSGKVYGGGGGGGTGAGSGAASPGRNGGDALYAQENLTIVVNAGGEIKAGGGGGGGGSCWVRTIGGEPTSYNGGGGGGGFPNGSGAPEGGGDVDVSGPGANGTTSAGGGGGTGGASTPGGPNRINGAGGAGGGAAAAGAQGGNVSGSGGSGTWTPNNFGAGGQPGYAIRKNGKTVTVTNNGTIAGAQG
jgi:YD repeat-containing protein